MNYKVLVNTGSSSEYGAKLHALRESDLPEPNSYYAVAKCAQTQVCQHMARADRRPVKTFSLFSVCGSLRGSRTADTHSHPSMPGREGSGDGLARHRARFHSCGLCR